MNKKSWILLAIFIAILIGIGIFFYSQNVKPNNQQQNNYEANKTATSSQKEDEKSTSPNLEESQSATNEITKGVTESSNPPSSPIEEQLATFTTKVYSNDSSRQNNISITCNTLNGTIVKKGETFSFCGTVGQSSTSKGYQKADIFDKDGNKKKGLGGRKLPN